MPSKPATRERRPARIQVISRAASILRALEHAPPGGLGLSDLARAAGVPKSTAHRLVAALEAEELVGATPAGGLQLGRGIARLGAATRDRLRDQAHPVLLRLHDELDETVDLAVLDGAAVRFVDHIPAPHRLRAVSAIGAAFPLHCTANGKALLAALPDDQAAALLPARLLEMTEHTITTRSALWEELGRIRVEHVAYDREEHTLGICAVGVVVHDPYGPAAAISVPVPTQRFAGQERQLADAVISAGHACSAALGSPSDQAAVTERE
jgi:DNA-binding IclR family transcriptional regulator